MSDATINLDKWYDADYATAQLGVSQKTLNVYVRDGVNIDGQNYKIQKAERPVPGRRNLPVYRPEDVDHIVSLRPAQAVALSSPQASPQLAGALTIGSVLAEAIRDARPSVAVFVGVAEAAKLSGLSRDMVKRLIKYKILPARLRGKWIIQRGDVEDLSIDDIDLIPKEQRKGA